MILIELALKISFVPVNRFAFKQTEKFLIVQFAVSTQRRGCDRTLAKPKVDSGKRPMIHTDLETAVPAAE